MDYEQEVKKVRPNAYAYDGPGRHEHGYVYTDKRLIYTEDNKKLGNTWVLAYYGLKAEIDALSPIQEELALRLDI